MVGNFLKSGKKKFLDFFPPPNLLKMSSFGLNISDHSIKVFELVHGSRSKIGLYGDESIQEDVIKSGTINDREALKKILQSIKNKYKMSFVRVSIPEEKAYVFKTKIPNVDNDSQIRSSIEFQLEDNVPLSISEALFDYEIIPSTFSNKSDIGISVFVLPKKVVASYVSLLNEVGLVPISFEIEAESIARSIIKKGDMKTYMIVDYGRTRTGFSVVSKGVVRYTSTVEVGGESINEILKKNTKLSEEEIERFKNEKGLIRDDSNNDMYMSLANVVSVLRDEINKRYIYWHTHKDSEGKVGDKISKILLVGGNSNLYGLKDYLSSGLKVEVDKADVWTNMNFEKKFVPPISFRKSLGYASAIGLASRKFGEK